VPVTGSCGLISSDVTQFELRLPKKDFKIDSADWMLSVTGNLPAIDCQPIDCETAVAELCAGAGCSGTCDAMNHCMATVAVSLVQDFNLSTEAPELQAIADQPILDVTVKTIAFEVTENSLNVATPPLFVYLAPQGVMDPKNTMATAIGSVASVAPGKTGTVNLELTAAGETAMESYMSNWKAPFNVIVAGDIAISAGQAVPTGKLVGAVTATAFVSP
jgi:hypothetical protein